MGNKNALVINGGVSKGAFAVGVVKKIFENYPALDFDILVGNGAGSLLIPFVALGEISMLTEIFTTKQDKDIVRKFSTPERIQESSIFDASPFWGLLNQYYTHEQYNKICSSHKQLYFNTLCLQSNACTFFSDKAALPAFPASDALPYTHRTIETYDQFLRTLLASAGVPVLLPPITIQPEEKPILQYIDGGARNYPGIELAMAAGATDIYTILLSPEAKSSVHIPAGNKEYGELFPVIQKTLDLFMADAPDDLHIFPNLYNEGLRYIDEVKKNMKNKGMADELIKACFETPVTGSPFYNRQPVKLDIIRPDSYLGGDPAGLGFDPPAMQTLLAKGEQKIMEYLSAHPPCSEANYLAAN
jgi:predicted acylesterase/phospholipase RssA